MIAETEQRRSPARDATLASLSSSLVFATILIAVHLYDWQAHAAFLVFSWLLWPGWYLLFKKRFESNGNPISWRTHLIAGLAWLFASFAYGVDIYLTRRPLPDQIEKLMVVIPLAMQFLLSMYHMRTALRLRAEKFDSPQ